MTSKPAKPKTTKRGRPKGAKSLNAPVVPVGVSRCPGCGSTERGPYHNTREIAHQGTTPDGLPYTHIVWRRCRCIRCGMTRLDKTFEQRGTD